ncbi:MAG TPA: hypothetical protein VF172_08350 [Nitrososphaera sp.]|jgi:hypothetical protein
MVLAKNTITNNSNMERGEGTTRSLGIKEQLLIIGGIAAVSAAMLFITIRSIGEGDSSSLEEFLFFFLNGQEITVKGMFVECVPTKMEDICIAGFRSSNGAYFVLTDHEIDDLSELVNQGHFQITGRFVPGVPEQFAAADVTGVISVSSITPIDSA